MSILLAVPSDAPGGLNADISMHFGHCQVFSIFAIEDGRVVDQSVVPFPAHEHGDCLVPVRLLAEHGVTVMVAFGMGARPLAGFLASGIQPYFAGTHRLVGEAVDAFLSGALMSFSGDNACAGHQGGCDHDHAH